jgi:hypothetical protein
MPVDHYGRYAFATLRVAPPEYIELAADAPPIARPLKDGQCWALVATSKAVGATKWKRCQLRASGRPGAQMCTCGSHRKWEKEAQKMKEGGK